MGRMYANGSGDRGSVIPKTQKMVLDAALFSIQYNKVRIKSKVEQSREWSSAFPYIFAVVAIEKRVIRSPSTMVTNFTLLYIYKIRTGHWHDG